MIEPTIRIVQPGEWAEIERDMKADFNNDMPVSPDQAVFLGAYHGEEMAAWVHVEHLYHFNCVRVKAQYRETGLALRLIKEAASRIPAGHSAIWLTPRSAANKIAPLVGARNIGTYQVFRKDA